MKFILGKKQAMTRLFSEDGKATPVTKVQAGPCFVTALKTETSDGYQAVQIGYCQKKGLSKALLGHLKNQGNFRHLKEFRVETTEKYDLGDQITVANFATGEKVKVSGVGKGRGFQGVVKRHGFHGSPASHGHKDQLRMPGSIGATDAARVFKGMRMGGHMGNIQVTIANLEIVKIDEADNSLYLKGAVPGARGTLLILQGPGEMELIKSVKKIADEGEDKKNQTAPAEKSETKEEKTTIESSANKSEENPKQAKDGDKENSSDKSATENK